MFAVHQLAQQWRELQRRKEARRGAYERAAAAAADAGEEGAAAAAAAQRCVELLQDVQTQEVRSWVAWRGRSGGGGGVYLHACVLRWGAMGLLAGTAGMHNS